MQAGNCFAEEWSDWSECVRYGHRCETPSQSFRLRQVDPEACAQSVDRRECFIECDGKRSTTAGTPSTTRTDGSSSTAVTTVAAAAAAAAAATESPHRSTTPLKISYEVAIPVAKSFFNTGTGGAVTVTMVGFVIGLFIYFLKTCCVREPTGTRRTRDEILQRNSVELLDLRNQVLTLRGERDVYSFRLMELEQVARENPRPETIPMQPQLVAPGAFGGPDLNADPDYDEPRDNIDLTV